ncbi:MULTISPECIES: hypothetical protein [unclassified Saccharicrinis]|uniref:hypothetical protein n=1 Tax=unclassified Saccharicrinis TaxID=2646859 RepID=UPI003D3256DC
MKIFFNVCILIGYILFGTFWLISSYDIITRNIWFDFFTIDKVKVSKFESKLKSESKNIYHVEYLYIVDSIQYKDETTAFKSALSKIEDNSGDIFVYYNKTLPNVSHIEGWEIKDYYKMSFIAFSFFLLLIFYIDKKVDKEKWIRRYSR